MNRKELWSVTEIIWKLSERYRGHLADHEAKMAEHRAAFGARTEADAKIIAGLREERDGLLTQVQDMRVEIDALNTRMRQSRGEYDAIKKERDGILTQVQDLRANLAKEQELHAKTALRLSTEAAKLVERKHPVKVGDYVKRLTGFNTTPAGEVARVTLVDDRLEYEVVRPNGQEGRWSAKGCEPCDPPAADHDTPQGKDAAESVIRDDRKSEPDEIKVGDVVEVVSCQGATTWESDLGGFGTVTRIGIIEDVMSVRLANLPGKKNAIGGYVALCDVRKVTT